MVIDPSVLVTIAGMAAVTYATRVIGYWFMGRFQINAFLRAWLECMRGVILVSLIAPFFRGAAGIEWLAATVTVGVAWVVGNTLAAMAAGMVALVVLRGFVG